MVGEMPCTGKVANNAPVSLISMSLSLAVAPGLMSAAWDAGSVAMDVRSPIVFRLNRLPVWRWAQACCINLPNTEAAC